MVAEIVDTLTKLGASADALSIGDIKNTRSLLMIGYQNWVGAQSGFLCHQFLRIGCNFPGVLFLQI